MASLVTDLASFAEFEALKASSKRVVLFFWASWHQPSSVGGTMHSIVVALAEKYGSNSNSNNNVAFYRVEAESVPEISAALGVSVVPSFVGMIGGSVIAKVDGAKPPEISKLVKAVAEANPATLPTPPPASSSGTTPNSGKASAATSEQPFVLTDQLRDRIKGLLSSSPVLLFMKGVPTAPRCGFSRQMVEILQANDVPFASFDILSDQDIRSGLKLYSDWPTFPQLYVGSELIGGLDILKEMVADTSAPLRTQLKIDELTAKFAEVQPKPLDERLKELINQAPVMLFMKGSPDAPRCGLSRTICQMLSSHNIPFSHFDILTDEEEVRAGLKVYSDWPTYPQLYVKGNLIGGLDIVKEMAEAGPLAPQLEL
jgi:Grx4 family monothiol glutaredoxin